MGLSRASVRFQAAREDAFLFCHLLKNMLFVSSVGLKGNLYIPLLDMFFLKTHVFQRTQCANGQMSLVSGVDLDFNSWFLHRVDSGNSPTSAPPIRLQTSGKEPSKLQPSPEVAPFLCLLFCLFGVLYIYIYTCICFFCWGPNSLGS